MSNFNLLQTIILEVFSKLILDFINKNLKIFKVFLKKSFKIKLHYRSGILVSAFILSLFGVNSTTEK